MAEVESTYTHCLFYLAQCYIQTDQMAKVQRCILFSVPLCFVVACFVVVWLWLCVCVVFFWHVLLC